jgi:hypothetical protein
MLRAPAVERADRVTAETDSAIKNAWTSEEVRAAIKRQLESLRSA